MTTQSMTTAVAQSGTEQRQQRAAEHPARRAVRRFGQHKLAVLGLVVMCLLLLSAAVPSLLAPHDPLTMEMRDRLQPPSLRHPLAPMTLAVIFSPVLSTGHAFLYKSGWSPWVLPRALGLQWGWWPAILAVGSTAS
ncbi:MAG: hypothetical protein R3E79_33880 [Caldilineaceae bacterium]